MSNLNKQKFKSPMAAYMGYLFQTFLKRPFGYIVAILYIVYLAVILVIVPAALHFAPLFIWNIGGFNMPIFNLFFIAGSAASIAVAVFRTGRDDGSDLNISAKPLTKSATVLLKTAVYLLIMLIICLITVAIVALIKPIFGVYNDLTNVTGIEPAKYIGIILSVLVGNLVNMLFFGGISVFISMVGGQVITIIGTIAIVFVMCLMNFLYPQVIQSSLDVLSNKYDADMLSYSCNTLDQLTNIDKNAEPYNFATIQCTVDDGGQEETHYDTKKYWDIAERESGRKFANYIDFGKQLSSLYSSFGLDESRLKEASKLVIGTNSSYNYTIDQSTHVADADNIENGHYPISLYFVRSRLGKQYPVVRVIGGDMSISTSNWYLYSTLYGINFDSVTYVSTRDDDILVTEDIQKNYSKPWNRMKDITSTLTQEQIAAAEELYAVALSGYPHRSISAFGQYANDIISKDNSGQFFVAGTYSSLSPLEKFNITSKILLVWAKCAHEYQNNAILTSEFTPIGETFPFSSTTVCDWRNSLAGDDVLYDAFNEEIFQSGITIDPYDEKAIGYCRLTTATMAYAETFSNLYKYSVSSFYKITDIIAIWSVLSCCLFASSIIVYKRTDFK